METRHKSRSASNSTSDTDDDVTADFTCWEKLSYRVSNGLNMLFYKLGLLVATYPWTTILLTWLVVGVASLGLMNFRVEGQALKLWVPQDSKLLHDTNRFLNSFDEVVRQQTVIIEADNVLLPSVLAKVALITNTFMNFTVRSGNKTIGWDDVCFKVPIIVGFVDVQNLFGQGSESSEEETSEEDDTFSDSLELESGDDTTTQAVATNRATFVPSVHLPATYFCGILATLRQGCLQENLMELFKYDDTKLGTLTLEDVLRALNTTKTSPVTGHEIDYVQQLSGIERNATGHIVSAKALMIRLMVPVKVKEVKREEQAFGEDWVTPEILAWEAEFNRLMARLKQQLDDDETKIYYSAASSLNEANVAIQSSEINKELLGFLLMFVYMQLVLSRVSWVEARLVLGICGLSNIGMALISGAGIAAALGFFTAPIHQSIPFLILGLGVDDVFVIIAALRRVHATQCNLSLVEKVGLAMKNAGTSVTITSLTDIIVFMVGATTSLPALRSFCVYATVCITMLYLFVITFFVAVLTLDERRVAARKNAIIPCIVHAPALTEPCFEKSILRTCLNRLYSDYVLTTVGKVVVVVAVLVMTGFNIQGLLQLRQQFNPTLTIPKGHHYYDFFVERQSYYPDMGSEAFVVMGELNYTQDLAAIVRMSEAMERHTDILYDVQSWAPAFAEFVNAHHRRDVRVDELTDSEWRLFLTQFLFSSQGGKYQHHFRFAEKLQCGKPAPNITSSIIDFKFLDLYNREQYLPAKAEIERVVSRADLKSGDGYSNVWSKVFIEWLTNAIIDTEIYRNIFFGLIGVMVCTAILIINLQMCFWILVTVIITLVNIGGMMHRWGLTLDIVTCMALQISVGLCVDYAAHVGHTFLSTTHGNRQERALETVLHIGPAVIYGATSTLLAFSVLSGSDEYSFEAFFKIFALVITYGLFHGLVLLPVILSQIGPDSYGGKKSRKLLPDTRHRIFTIFSPHSKNNYDVTGEAVVSEKPHLFRPIENPFSSKA